MNLLSLHTVVLKLSDYNTTDNVNMYEKENDQARDASWRDFCIKSESIQKTSNVMKILEGHNKGGSISIMERLERILFSPHITL